MSKVRGKTARKSNSTSRAAADSGGAAAEWVSLRQLAPWAGNPRKNDANVQHVAALIVEFGFGSPVLARVDNRELIAGHTRVKACQLLPQMWEAATPAERERWSADARRIRAEREVPARYMPLDEAKAHLFALADNRSGELSPWDLPALQLAMSDYELDELTLAGWDKAALDKLAASLAEPELVDAGTEDAWNDMPEFEQHDSVHRRLVVNFRNQQDVDDFARLIDQRFGEKVKAIWHPERPRSDLTGVQIVSDDDEQQPELDDEVAQ